MYKSRTIPSPMFHIKYKPESRFVNATSIGAHTLDLLSKVALLV